MSFGGDLEAFVTHHTEFHTDVGALAGNRVMQLSLMAIGQTVTHHIAYTADPRDVADILLHDHRVIAAAIIAGKPIKSRDQMRIHLERRGRLLRPPVGRRRPRSADRVALRRVLR